MTTCTFSIHVATANTTGSYMTVPGLLIAACGCVVDYCTLINSQVWAAVQLLCMGVLTHGLGAYEPMCTPLATPLHICRASFEN